ncbi:GAF and ANTAR domain-containing protein [Actinomycetospora atypica]|uniref:GAF and ANTAR domain-containing protein n=1 Tax=Actinomycetospora atypica TaxID=1290095 RepID=A0ABV9YVR3_9PSEU
MTDIDTLVTALRAAAHGLVRHSIRDMETVLTQIVAAAAETVPGADGGGISRSESGAVQASHATSVAIRELDQLQVELNEGPCATAGETPPESGIVVAVDLEGPDDVGRWPTFAPAAARAGYRSVMSAHLSPPAGREAHAALNLYAREPGVFSDQARTMAGLFATQASLLLYGADQAAHLQRAVSSRDLIGQAKGILMERFSVGADQAFEMLISASQETNVKLVTVATWLTTAEVPAGTRRGPTPELHVVRPVEELDSSRRA